MQYTVPPCKICARKRVSLKGGKLSPIDSFPPKTYLGHLGAQEESGGLTGGEEVVLGHVNAETLEFLLQLAGSGGRVVGQEEELLVVLVQEVNELLGAGQKLGTL